MASESDIQHAQQMKRLRDAYAKVFNDSPEAQLVLEDLKVQGHFMASVLAINTRTPAPVDPLLMAYRDGERHMVLYILTMREAVELESLIEQMSGHPDQPFEYLHGD